ncbi:hypothetical protein AVEN_19054-1 [Araneus ventricosus]|uniref:Uncharacterized protein n=1 Tax=Araneus ventricosus TaxID=182803 RepID=A0A4Y2VTY1_ARAVE|nr:hypothetical protein AVEN_19054-1 [Araneus ventricosus]
MHGGSSVESGFEPDHSRSKSRDLTTGPPRPRLHDTKQHNMFNNGFRDYHFWMILHWKGEYTRKFRGDHSRWLLVEIIDRYSGKEEKTCLLLVRSFSREEQFARSKVSSGMPEVVVPREQDDHVHHQTSPCEEEVDAVQAKFAQLSVDEPLATSGRFKTGF